jgi:hypothetical protein
MKAPWTAGGGGVRGGRVARDVLRVAGECDAAVQHDGGDVAHAEHGLDELLDDEDRQAASREVGDALVELFDDERCEAHRQLVEQQHRRVGGDRTGHREHLLLASRQRPGELVPSLAEAGELRERALAHVGERRAGVRAHPQVLGDRQVGEHAAPLRHETHAGARERVAAGAVHLAPAQEQLPGGRPDLAAAHRERRRLPGAIGAEQRIHLARLQDEVDAVQHIDGAVARTDVPELEHRRRRHRTTEPR